VILAVDSRMMLNKPDFHLGRAAENTSRAKQTHAALRVCVRVCNIQYTAGFRIRIHLMMVLVLLSIYPLHVQCILFHCEYHPNSHTTSHKTIDRQVPSLTVIAEALCFIFMSNNQMSTHVSEVYIIDCAS
jgi:hypothetical protein